MADAVLTDLALLEQLIAKLQVAYEQFFSGGTGKEPLDLVRQVEAILRTYSIGKLSNQVIQFRFNSLQARYNSLRNVWERRRKQSEGTRSHAWGVKNIRSTPEENQYTLVVTESSLLKGQVDELFGHYLAIRRRSGEPVDKIRRENFAAILAENVKKIRARSGCSAVLVKVDIHENRSRISAKPFHDQP